LKYIDVSLPSSSVVLAEPGGIYHFGFRCKTFTGIILCITVTFPGNVCPEVVRQQPEEIPGGGEEVEETAIGSPPENHSGPPGSTIDAAQLPHPWWIGRDGPLLQDMLSLLEEIWQEDWLLELASLQMGQEEVALQLPSSGGPSLLLLNHSEYLTGALVFLPPRVTKSFIGSPASFTPP
jgi:hypothetical protein